MKLLQQSEREKTIQWIWEWFDYHQTLSMLSKAGLMPSLVYGLPDADPRFYGMTGDEIEDFFAELGHVAALDLMAAAEAALRLDYWTRVEERRKDPVSRQFRALYKERQLHVRWRRICWRFGAT